MFSFSGSQNAHCFSTLFAGAGGGQNVRIADLIDVGKAGIATCTRLAAPGRSIRAATLPSFSHSGAPAGPERIATAIGNHGRSPPASLRRGALLSSAKDASLFPITFALHPCNLSPTQNSGSPAGRGIREAPKGACKQALTSAACFEFLDTVLQSSIS